MKKIGIWSESVHLYGTHFKDHFVLAILVLSFIALIGLFVVSLREKKFHYQGDDATLRERAFGFFGLAIWALMGSYILKIVDIFLREFGVKVKYGYLFTHVFAYGYLIAANMLVLMIVCRMTYFQFPLMGANMIVHTLWRIFSKAFLIILSALALFDFSVFAAVWILYLNGQKTDMVTQVGKEWTRIDHAFQIVYLVVSIIVLVFTAVYLVARTKLREKPNTVETKFVLVAILVFIRSVNTESSGSTVSSDYQTSREAIREALFGIPSVAIFYLISKLSRPLTNDIIGHEIRREGREIARKEFARRRYDADHGGPALPSPLQLLQEIEKRPMAYLPESAGERMSGWPISDVQSTLAMHVDDLLRLREKF